MDRHFLFSSGKKKATRCRDKTPCNPLKTSVVEWDREESGRVCEEIRDRGAAGAVAKVAGLFREESHSLFHFNLPGSLCGSDLIVGVR
jgi:hypothetical protein